MLIETPENELKSVFFMKLNAQSLKICNKTLHSARTIFSRKCYFLFEISLNCEGPTIHGSGFGYAEIRGFKAS